MSILGRNEVRIHWLGYVSIQLNGSRSSFPYYLLTILEVQSSARQEDLEKDLFEGRSGAKNETSMVTKEWTSTRFRRETDNSFDDAINFSRIQNSLALKERVYANFLQIASNKVSCSSFISSCTRIPNWQWRFAASIQIVGEILFDRFPFRFFHSFLHYCVQLPEYRMELNRVM